VCVFEKSSRIERLDGRNESKITAMQGAINKSQCMLAAERGRPQEELAVYIILIYDVI
jgi:hypothetical protein